VVEPVCVNASEAHFSVPRPQDRPRDEDGNPRGVVRFGMAAVKNVGLGAIEAIIEARREAGGAFTDAFDLFDRVDHRRVNKRVFEHLIKAGALDFSGVPRVSLLAGLDVAVGLGTRRQADKAAGQMGLFGGAGGQDRPEVRWPEVETQPFSQQMASERDALGLYLSGHPMQAHQRDVKRFGTVAISQLGPDHGRDEVRLVGLVVQTRVRRTRRGDKMAVVRIEDDRGSVECTFFRDAWARSQRALESGQPVVVSGSVELRDDEVKLKGSTAETLTEVRARSTREVRFSIRLSELEGAKLDRFLALLASMRGNCASRLVLRADGRYEAELLLPQHPVEPSPEMEESVHALFGRTDVVALG